jgi:hypothetical protein
MKSNIYHTDKPQTRQQLLEHINEATIAIRHNMETHQNIRYSMERCLAACIQAEDHFKNLKFSCKPLRS